MGQRANLVVITPGGTELYYSHWRANTLDRELFWGPDHATAFARMQRSESEGAKWLDEIWSEGGAVIDHVRRSLIWYGGEDVVYDVPRRRVALALMRSCWEGWEIEWAAEGILDLAKRAGVPADHVLSPPEDVRAGTPELASPQQRNWVDGVITVVDRGQARVVPLVGHPGHWLNSAPALLSAVREQPGLSRFDYAEWSSTFPQGGLHVDFDQCSAGFWLAPPFENAVARAVAALPGFEVEFWRDRYERHLELTRGYLDFPGVDPIACIADLRHTLLGESESGGKSLLRAVESLRGHGSEVTNINPFALRDDSLELPPSHRMELFEHAVAEWYATRE